MANKTPSEIPDKRRKLTDEQVQQIQTLYYARVPELQIAQHFNVTIGAIRYYTSQARLSRWSIPEVLEALA